MIMAHDNDNKLFEEIKLIQNKLDTISSNQAKFDVHITNLNNKKEDHEERLKKLEANHNHYKRQKNEQAQSKTYRTKLYAAMGSVGLFLIGAWTAIKDWFLLRQ